MASTSGSYTCQGGETLAMIAQNLWGDASLWYLLADANGVSGAVQLTAGQTITIPNRVINRHNTADTFRPYDPNEAMGDTSPTTAAKPPKAKKGACGVFGKILQAIVTVAVSIVMGPIIGDAVGQLFGMATGIQQGGFNWKELAMAGLSAVVGAGVGAVLGQGALRKMQR